MSKQVREIVQMTSEDFLRWFRCRCTIPAWGQPSVFGHFQPQNIDLSSNMHLMPAC